MACCIPLLALLLLAGAQAAAAAPPSGGAYGCAGGSPCCPAGQACAGAGKLPPCPVGAARASSIWGCNGEALDAARLPMDWSWAGYRGGQAGLPAKPQSVNVKACCGAKGDGVTDDTEAVTKAIQEAKEGTAVFFPPGKYVITKQINIRKSVVLRGAGKGATTLYFPVSLEEAHGRPSSWAHGTCFINFWGWVPILRGGPSSTQLARVTADVARGAHKLPVDSGAGFKPGQWVRLVTADTPEAFKATLMRGLTDTGYPGAGAAKDIVRFSSPVKAAGADYVVLERALPWDIRASWAPSVHALRPTVEEGGVEGMTFEFKWTPYPGHLAEKGYNALHFNQLVNSWVKDVEFVNADTAIYFWGVGFSTVQDVDIDTTKPRFTDARTYGASRNGHRGVWSEFGESNLFQRIAIKAPFVHDFTVATAELGSVWTDSFGSDLNLDFHKGGPTLNLYTQLDMGAGSRPFKSGGGQGVGPNSGAGNTFWNLKSNGPLQLPNGDFGPALNFVGVQSRDASAARLDAKWLTEGGDLVEAAPSVVPANLWQAMRSRRG